jgi:fibronectin-binding autotransporter adhesin
MSVRRARGITRGMLIAATAGIAGVAGAFDSPALAVTNYFWDPGASVSGTGSGGSGTWDTSSLNWYPGTGTADVAWPNTTSYNASFGGTLPGTVTLGTNIVTGGLTFATTGYTIAGGTYALNLGSGGLTVAASSGTAAISGAALNLTSAQNWNIGSGGLVTISAPISDSAGQLSLNLSSGSTFNFSGGGAFTGQTFLPGAGVTTNLTGGTLTSSTLVANNGAAFSVDSGATLNLTNSQFSAQGPGYRNNANNSSLILNGGTIISDGIITIAHGTEVGTITLNSGELDTTYGIGTDSGTNQGTINFAGATVKLLGSLSDLANASNTNNSGAAITMNDVGGGGGAVINTNSFNLGLAENILHTTGNGSPDGGITKLGLGTLTLSGASSTYNGGVNISQGTIVASSKTALGAATATIGLSFTPASGNTATVDFNSATGTIASLSNPGLGTSSLVLGNTGPINGSASVLTIGNANVSSSLSTTFSGTISDLSGSKSSATGEIVKTGASTLILSGSNSFTGGVELFSNNAGSGNNGVLIPLTNSAFGTGTIQSDMSGGSELGEIQLTGGITLSNSITAATRTIPVAIANPNFLNTAGNNTLNGNISIGSGGNAFGLASISGILTVNGSFTNTASSARTLELSGSALGVFNGVIYNSGNGAIVEKDGTGTWQLTNTNSYQGGTAVYDGTLTGSTGSFGSGSVTVSPNGVTSTAADNATLNSNGSIGSLAAVTVNSETTDGGFGIGQINFNSIAPVIGSLTGNGTVALANPSGTILTTGGANSSTGFSGTITDASGLSGLIKTGNGTFNLSGTGLYGGGTNVASGTLVLASATAFPSGVANAGTGLIVGSGATLMIANHGSGATVVPYVSSLTNNGTIDITNNALVLRNANASIGTISSEVAAAFNGGAWNGTGGSIITSSTAATDSTRLTAVGVATGLTSFEGATVSASDVLIKYTYYGDANLDGHVDGSDYSLIDNGYLNGLTGWQNGDFNYDGVVNGSDYTLIDNAFNSQGAALAVELASPDATATAQIAGSGATSAVPEPASLALLGIGAVGLLGRRRRGH